MLKKKRKIYKTYLLPVLLALCILCFGCGDAEVEVMAGTDSVGTDSESETLSGNSVNDADGSTTEAAVTDDTGARSDDTVSGNIPGVDSAPGDSAAENDTQAASDEGPGLADPRPEPVKVKGIYVSGPVAGIAKMDDLIDLVDRTELNAMVIDIKNDEGKVTYKMQSEQVLEIESGVRYIADIDELIAKCKEKDIYLIARIVAFRDPYLAERKPEWAVRTKNGEIFRDKNGMAWVNPYCREMWDYLVEIASQAAQVGFDEVQFDYIRFSTDIGEEEVDYGPESEGVDKIQIITEFTEYVYECLVPQGVYVAADVFGTVIDNETDQVIVGQDYVQMASHLDYICPMVYPSHYHNGSYGIKVPDAEPYRTIYAAASSSVQELGVVPEENRARVRTWLQGFTARWVPGHINYGPEQIRAQIKGAYDAGYDEWILWNASVNYQPEAFLTEEEAEAERQQWDAEKRAAEEMQSHDDADMETMTSRTEAESQEQPTDETQPVLRQTDD